MKKLIWTFLVFLAVTTGFSQEAGLLLTQANQAYRNGEFEKASSLYGQIATNGYESSALYYNLGNARFKLKDVPGAILYFEKARKLAPHDEDISYNLRLANLRVIDKIEPIPEFFLTEWWHTLLRLYSSATWAFIAVAGLWIAVACAGVVMVIRVAVVRRTLALAGTALVLVSAFSFVSMMVQERSERSERGAIIFTPSISIKSSPDAQSTDLFVLHEGVKVELLDNVENWLKIRLPDGKIGWIPTSAIQVI